MIKRIINFIRKRIDPIGFAKSQGVKLGLNCRLINVDFGSEPWLVKLGNHVSISDSNFITHDGGVWVFREENQNIEYLRPISVGDNVFIGSRTIILPGVHIGNNVVIGAGSIVSKNIPNNCVAVGVPAKIIKNIDQYKNKVFSDGDLTKKFTQQEKRIFYCKKFHEVMKNSI